MSIDVGIIHFGISMANVRDDGILLDVYKIELIDITQYTHRNDKKECKLQHTKTMADWVDHLIQENQELFDQADLILVERQPPSGLIAIEQLIFSKFRAKTYLVSPRNVHSYLSLTSFDYDKRKVYSERIAYSYLSEEQRKQILLYDRFHDIADSICMLLYWCNKHKNEYEIEERKRRHREALCKVDGLNVFEKLERFRYFRVVE